MPSIWQYLLDLDAMNYNVRHLFLFAAVLLLAVTDTAVASPQEAWYSDDADHLFWFVVIADSHIGCQFSCGDSDTENLDWATGEAFQVIEPRLMFDCGDLVDGTNGGLIPNAQYDQEWGAYEDIVVSNGATTANFVDMPGNHDQYYDKGLTHYLDYSVQGTSDQNTQHSVVLDEESGAYHFLAVATPANDGAGMLFDKAGLDASEMPFIESSFLENTDANLQFAFGHHGVKWGGSNKVGEGSNKFLSLLKTHSVAAYFWGHTHDYYSEFHDGTLFFNTRSLGKSGDLNFTIAAVDHDSLSVRAFTARDWPYVLITAPADAKLGKSNPYAYSVPLGWNEAPVRAVVFSKDLPQTVEFQVDGSGWSPMAEVDTNVYQGWFDATLLAEMEHELRVRALPWSDVHHQITFKVQSLACSNGIDDDNDGYFDFPNDPGCVNPADPDETDPPPLPEPEPEPVPEPIPDTLSGDIGHPDEADSVDDFPDTILPDTASPDGPILPDDSATGNDSSALPETGIADAPVIEVVTDSSVETWKDDDTNVQPDMASEKTGRPGGGCTAPGRLPTATSIAVTTLAVMFLSALLARRRRYS